MTALHTTAWCADPWHPCDWTAEGPDADRQAEKHARDTGHGTVTHSTPIDTPSTVRPIDTGSSDTHE